MAVGGGGGGKGGGGGGGKGGSTTTTKDIDRTTTRFAPFQSDVITKVFDVLGGDPGLFQVPELSSDALSNALGFGNELLAGSTGAQSDLLNLQSLINEDLGTERFNDVIDRFETIGNRAAGAFSPFIDLALSLGRDGIDPRAGELLLETAQRDPVSNPFIDRLVGDVSTDISNAVLDQFIGSGSGGLEASAAPEAVARAIGREANQIRSAAFESEAGRALQAQQALGQLDAANAQQKLNAAATGGNLTNQRFGVELGSAGGVFQGTKAEADRRLANLGLRAQNEGALTNLQLAGLSAIPGLSPLFAQLPFIPLTSISEIAFAPLGERITGTERQIAKENPGALDLAKAYLDIGLKAASLGSSF